MGTRYLPSRGPSTTRSRAYSDPDLKRVAVVQAVTTPAGGPRVSHTGSADSRWAPRVGSSSGMTRGACETGVGFVQ